MKKALWLLVAASLSFADADSTTEVPPYPRTPTPVCRSVTERMLQATIWGGTFAGGTLLAGATFVYHNPEVIQRPRLFKGWQNRPSLPPKELSKETLYLDDGTPIAVWSSSRQDLSKPTVVYFYGNNGSMEKFTECSAYEEFQNHKYNLVLFDYPGYGNSGGKPSEKSVVDAGVRVVQWAQKGGGHGPLILMGHSLGAAVAIQTAARLSRPADLLTVVAPWSSFEALMTEDFEGWLKRWPGKEMVKKLEDKFDSAEAIKKHRGSILIAHGNDDPLIPPKHSDRLQKERPDATLIKFENFGHSGQYREFNGSASERERFWRLFHNFVENSRRIQTAISADRNHP